MAKTRKRRLEDAEVVTSNASKGGVITAKEYARLKGTGELSGNYLVVPGALTPDEFQGQVKKTKEYQRQLLENFNNK